MKFMKNALLAVIAVAGAVVSANAQSATVPSAKLEKPITVKLGAYFPQSGSSKNAGSTWFLASVNYDVLKTASASPITVGAYLDFSAAEKSMDGVKYKRGFLGIGPQGKYYFAKPGATVTPYAGAGLGIYFVNGKDGSDSSTKTHIGYKLLAGAEFAQGFVGELSYHFPGNVRDGNVNGFGVQLGYRF
jgi:opacity protein-like surface antigen